MEKHYIGGYYVIKTKALDWGEYNNQHIFTLSSCINMPIFDNWCLNWDYEYENDGFNEEFKTELGLTDKKINDIRKWTNNSFDNLAGCLPTLEMAKEFKDLFFKERDDIQIYCLSFPETDAEKLLNDFAEGNNTKEFNFNNGNLSLRHNLLEKKIDIDKENELVLGYDFIGMECDGSFHSFHCHGIIKEIKNKFCIEPNSHGLYDKLRETAAIRVYLNNPQTAVEPLPWYIGRVKLIKQM